MIYWVILNANKSKCIISLIYFLCMKQFPPHSFYKFNHFYSPYLYGAGGRIRTDVSKADGLQDRSNRPLWDSCSSLCFFCNVDYTLFCLISFSTKKSYSLNKDYCATKRAVYCLAFRVVNITDIPFTF